MESSYLGRNAVNIFNIYHVKHANEVYLLIYSTYIKIRVRFFSKKHQAVYVITI